MISFEIICNHMRLFQPGQLLLLQQQQQLSALFSSIIFFFFRLLWFSLYSQRFCFYSGVVTNKGNAGATAAVEAQCEVRHRTKAPKCWNKEVPYLSTLCVCVRVLGLGCYIWTTIDTLFCFLMESVAKPHTERGGGQSKFEVRLFFFRQVTKIELALENCLPLHVCCCLSCRAIKKGDKQTCILNTPSFLCLFHSLLSCF